MREAFAGGREEAEPGDGARGLGPRGLKAAYRAQPVPLVLLPRPASLILGYLPYCFGSPLALGPPPARAILEALRGAEVRRQDFRLPG